MRYLVYEINADSGDVVQVTLSQQANVKLMDSSSYSNYRSGRSHHYYGGLAKVSPINISVPYAGHWYVTVDLGGYSGSVRASVQVI
ncbi:MAG: DUF1883 domain-containing protein [Abitibacteriaceae bacterium]|nr:DUF1883 domain-containing protein [Abditibacteriaceae bacterium]